MTMPVQTFSAADKAEDCDSSSLAGAGRLRRSTPSRGRIKTLNNRARPAHPAACGQVRKGRRKAKMSMDMWTILRLEKRGRPGATADGAAGEERSGMSSFENLTQAFFKRGHAVAKFPRRFRA